MDNYAVRKLKEKIFLSFAWLALLLTAIILVVILGQVVYNGASAINIGFFFERPAPPGEPGGGIGPGIQGTVVLMALASLMGIPLGIIAGIYMAEFSESKLASAIRYFNDVLTEFPSIVIGVFAYTSIVIFMRTFSAIAGAFALAIIMIPIVARTTEESVKLVPASIREAALALGIPRWKTTLRIVLSTARQGTITGIMLSLGRIAGETAPLIVTVGFSFFYFGGFDKPVAALPLYIYTFAISPFESWRSLAWGSALVLVIMVLVVNIVVRTITRQKYR
ncbi:MAG: phosphate ABC transporter permease PstA [Thaumarchaeota archaeon]|nr:phosphate ABC transporter permease PstA [Nitrososphaerota archaeon]